MGDMDSIRAGGWGEQEMIDVDVCRAQGKTRAALGLCAGNWVHVRGLSVHASIALGRGGAGRLAATKLQE